jgi:hypothetical protein
MTGMRTINSEQFGEICSRVWNDRAAVLMGRGLLSGDAALVRAVYWRLFKVGVRPPDGVENQSSLQTMSAYRSGVCSLVELSAQPGFDAAPILKELVERYEKEIRDSC